MEDARNKNARRIHSGKPSLKAKRNAPPAPAADKQAAPRVRKASKKKAGEGVSVPVVGTDGKAGGTTALPEELFDAKLNMMLLAQAVRVYRTNTRIGGASTKTRSEVEGSTRKLFRQKGTGRARHGAIRAPIFVGGGIVFGPRPRNYHLEMTKQMRRKALAVALTQKLRDHAVTVIAGLEELEPKTKLMAQALSTYLVSGKTLLITGMKAPAIRRGAGNIGGLTILPAKNLNAYDVLAHHHILIMKQAIDELIPLHL
ncbi:50S ribosomal protein L4 [Patescibacteria group bacterium]|nr:50S ribosomal protein L4 [Patescibacteria group bacterium]